MRFSNLRRMRNAGCPTTPYAEIEKKIKRIFQHASIQILNKHSIPKNLI
jgi:hypothetical protein